MTRTIAAPARSRVVDAFTRAKAYEAHAPVQHRVALGLAHAIAALPLSERPRALEFGCGTGFLTRALLDAQIPGDWLLTDLSPAMVERCRNAIGDAPDRRFATLDGEYGTPDAGPFDLICSSLALQWFDDAPAALARMADWLAPDGHLIVTTLGPGTFAEWRAAHTALGLVPGTPAFATVEAFADLPGVRIDIETLVEPSRDARSFLHAVKAIGAGTPHSAHVPLSPSQLRAVMVQFERNGAAATYEVVTIHLTAPRRREAP